MRNQSHQLRRREKRPTVVLQAGGFKITLRKPPTGDHDRFDVILKARGRAPVVRAMTSLELRTIIGMIRGALDGMERR